MSRDVTPALRAHFAGRKANVTETYQALLRVARALGPVNVQPHKTSIHLVRETAFAGVATQKDALVLTIKAAADIRSPRIRRHEQASARRWHLQLKLTSPREVDVEVAEWLRAAYELSD